MTIDEALDEISVMDPEQWENESGPAGWFAVCDQDGIIAYFGSEVNAYHFRLALINAKLNPILALMD